MKRNFHPLIRLFDQWIERVRLCPEMHRSCMQMPIVQMVWEELSWEWCWSGPCCKTCVWTAAVFYQIWVDGVRPFVLRPLKALEQPEEELRETVQDETSDKKSNIQWIAETSNCKLHRLHMLRTSHYEQLYSVLMVLGTHGHMFCSVVHFEILYELWVGKVKEEGEHEQVVKSEQTAAK